MTGPTANTAERPVPDRLPAIRDRRFFAAATSLRCQGADCSHRGSTDSSGVKAAAQAKKSMAPIQWRLSGIGPNERPVWGKSSTDRYWPRPATENHSCSLPESGRSEAIRLVSAHWRVVCALNGLHANPRRRRTLALSSSSWRRETHPRENSHRRAPATYTRTRRPERSDLPLE